VRCRTAQRLLHERRADALAGAAARGLEAHLAACAACARAARLESAIAHDLSRLRALAPPPVDVARRVLDELAALPDARATALRALAWSVALLFGLLCVLGAVSARLLQLASAEPAGVSALSALAQAALRAGAALARVSLDLLATLGGFGLRLASHAAGALGAWDVRAVAPLAALVVISTAAAIVGRELFGPRAAGASLAGGAPKES